MADTEIFVIIGITAVAQMLNHSSLPFLALYRLIKGCFRDSLYFDTISKCSLLSLHLFFQPYPRFGTTVGFFELLLFMSKRFDR